MTGPNRYDYDPEEYNYDAETDTITSNDGDETYNGDGEPVDVHDD